MYRIFLALFSLLMFVPACTQQSGAPNEVVAKFNGTSIKASDAFGRIQTQLYDKEEELYRFKEQAIQEYMEQKLLEAESKKQNITPEALLEKEAGGPVEDVDDKEIESFLASKNLSLSDPRIKKDDVREYLKYKKRLDKKTAFVNKLKNTAKVEIFLKEPQAPKVTAKTDGFPTWGNPKAPVTIVEFSDYQCPFCSRAVPVLSQVKKEYGPDKVRIVFRDMPLPSHDRANAASLAAHCANDQGKFWEFHDHLFENQVKLSDDDLKRYAKDIGLEAAKFDECYTSKKHQALIDQSKEEAEALGISATPTFLINGTILQGAQPFDKFKERIDRAARG